MEDNNKSSKKKPSFFCCSSGNKRRDIKDFSENTIKGSSIISYEHVTTEIKKLENSNFNPNELKRERENIPRIPTKDNSLIDISNHVESIRIPNDRVKNIIPISNKHPVSEVEVIQNLNSKFNEAASVQNIIRSKRSKEDFPLQMQNSKYSSNREKEVNPSSSPTEANQAVFNSGSKDKISIHEGVDFTFKKSIVDTRSELPFNAYNKMGSSPNKYYSNHNSNNEIFDYINNRDNFKLSVTSAGNVCSSSTCNNVKDTKVNPNNEVEAADLKMKDMKQSNTISYVKPVTVLEKVIKLTPLNILSEENMAEMNDIGDMAIEDEFYVNDDVNEREDVSDIQSVISSKILSHINTPKMIGGIKSSDQSYNYSNYSKSEISRIFETQNNILYTDINMMSHLPEDTEYDITNENNSDRFNKFIETPKNSNLFFNNYPQSGIKNSQSLISLQNNTSNHPHFRELNERYSRKEKEARKLNEKIQKIVSELHKMEEETKRYERKIDKEESEGEMLKHMLNFLMSNA